MTRRRRDIDGYRDRQHAGRTLARSLDAYRGRSDVLVLALPRGGVPVAAEVARHLGAPLDVMIVRKLGVPGHEEMAMGAIASGGVTILNDDIVESLGIERDAIDAAIDRERGELERRERAYRGDRPPAAVRGRTVIIVDDGLATGATMKAAIAALHRSGVSRVVAAAPVAPPDSLREVAALGDDIVCPLTPASFMGVGRWYANFDQTTDDEVRAILETAHNAEIRGRHD